ncbi:MAG: methyltransferase domain-containing protein [Rhizobiales bacterium]|nr:methyltransferase domain-containing protein [Hyphomicrobiales bacterium]
MAPTPNSKKQSKDAGLIPRFIVQDWLYDIFRRGKSLDDVFAISEQNSEWQKLPSRDRAFARSLLMTTLRHRGEIEWLLAKFLKKPPQAKTRVNEILSIGVAQLLFMEVSDHAAIDTSVRLAKRSDKSRHLAKLVNAILRQVTRAKPEDLIPAEGPLINVPEFWRKRWAKHYGKPTAEKIAQACLEPAALDIIVKKDASNWATKLKGTVLGASDSRAGYGVRKDHRGIVTELEGFDAGEWWIQDFSAHLPCTLFESTPGFGTLKNKSVADLCAAPGGKTAALLNRGAEVTSVDVSEKRLSRLSENLERLNFSASVVQSDVLTFTPDERFDAVLLDAPCSATGTIRRHPDILYLKTESLISELQALQRQMLEKTSTLLKPGGIIIYCTCSLEPEEGEEQIEHFLQKHEDFERVPISSEEISGHSEWLTKSGDVRLLPFFSPFKDDEWAGMDGFFISRLRLKP